MSLSAPRIFFGVHSVTPYNRSTGLFYGTAKVIGEFAMALSGEVQKLYGGSSPFAWAIENGVINSEISFKLKQYEDFLLEIFYGKAPTATGADAAGAVSTLTNKYGTSVVAATGIATATVKAANKTDLKFGRGVVKAVSATTVDVYWSSDVDFNRGTDKEFVNDALKITATPLTITASTATEIPGFGIELTGGAGTIAMVVGDTATFEVKPPSSKSMEVTIGGSTDVFPEVGVIAHGQQNGSGEMVEIEIFRCKGIGMPITLAEKKFSEPELKLDAVYDSSKNGIAKIRHLTPS